MDSEIELVTCFDIVCIGWLVHGNLALLLEFGAENAQSEIENRRHQHFAFELQAGRAFNREIAHAMERSFTQNLNEHFCQFGQVLENDLVGGLWCGSATAAAASCVPTSWCAFLGLLHHPFDDLIKRCLFVELVIESDDFHRLLVDLNHIDIRVPNGALALRIVFKNGYHEVPHTRPRIIKNSRTLILVGLATISTIKSKR